MSIRTTMISYSRGNDLNWFWRFYRRQGCATHGISRDFWTFFMSRSAHRHGGYVGPGAVFLGRPSLPHGLHGIFVSRYAVVGKDCLIYQNVTIGEVNGKAPVIGERCLIGAGAVIVGDVTIGNDVKIGAGAVVVKDVPDGCTVVAQPVRILESV